MRKFLITGATSRLGQCLIPKINRKFKGADLFLTARSKSRLSQWLDEKTQGFELDLNEDFQDSHFSFFLKKGPLWDSVIHCASSYPTQQVMQASESEFRAFTQYIANEIQLLRALAQKLKPSGSLIVCGSVAGMRSDVDPSADIKESMSQVSHIGNFNQHCSLHALHKGIVYDTVNCLYQSNPDKSVIYSNIGPFMPDVPEEQKKEILSTDLVADHITKLIPLKRLNQCSVDIVAEETAKKLSELRAI